MQSSEGPAKKNSKQTWFTMTQLKELQRIKTRQVKKLDFPHYKKNVTNKQLRI